MKTLGLLVTTAIVLPLGACMERDRCDSNGWCDGTSSTQQVCFYDHDCGSGYRCEGGSCVARPPVPPPRDAGGAGGSGGATGVAGASGSGGSRPAADGGGDRGGGAGVTGTGGARPIDAGPTGTGGAPAVDAGAGTGGAGQPADGGVTPGCDAGGNGGCHPHPVPVCQFDNQCGLHGRCADGECQRACATGAECGTGQLCTQGYCVTPATSGGQCVYNADCGARRTCINGFCHADCSADSDCPGTGGDHCVAGICQPDTGPHPQCRASADCAGLHVTDDVCVDAVCRTECLSDVDCCVGSSGSICQMGYCVTAHEVTPQCRISPDCGSGQTCLDAACG